MSATLTKKNLAMDFNNWKQLRSYMDTYGETLDHMLFGENEDGEDIQISINPDNIVLETHQNNHWVRKNTYWYDGTVEERFEGRW